MASDGSIKITTELDNAKTEKAMSRFEGIAKKGCKGVKFAVATVGTALGVMAGYSIKTGIQFESSFAGVKKTVNATEQELATMRQGIRDMTKEVPQSAASIAGVAEAAGQLGIKNKNILSFTRTMTDLGVSTNMSATEAATALARLANITQMPQDSFQNLGSVVVDLGNNLATTESEIVEMGLRLAGAGKQVGMSEAQILGLAGAISSVGIDADAGGSAVSTVMAKMQLAVEKGGDALDDFASVAGMSADEFKTAFETDAAQALVSFVTGLSDMDESGQSAIATLDDMGITEIRQRDALLRLSGAGDVLAQSLDIATNAWGENNALTKEAEQRYETLESKLQIFKNGIGDFGITIYDSLRDPLKNAVEIGIESVDRLQGAFESGGVKAVVKETGEMFGEFSDKVAETSDVAAGIVEPLKNIAGNAINLAKTALPQVVKAIETLTKNSKVSIPVITGLAAGYKSLTSAKKAEKYISTLSGTVKSGMKWWKSTAKVLETYAIQMEAARYTGRMYNVELTAGQAVVGAFTGKVTIATAAQTAWNAVLNANPIAIVVTAVAALAAGLGAYALITDANAEKTSMFTAEEETLRGQIDETAKSIREAKDAREEAVNGVLEESTHTQALADELRGIVDENGNVKAGYEARAAFITSTLADALGLEINLVDGQIQGYGELVGAIDKAIEKKKAEAVLNAYEADYQTAIKNKTQALQEYLGQQEASAEASRELAKAESELENANNKAKEELEEYGRVGDDTTLRQEQASAAVQEAKEKYDEQSKSLQDAKSSYEEYNNTIQTYEGLSSAIISGDSTAIQTALAAIQTNFKYHGQATDAELKTQAVQAGNNMVLLGENIKSGAISAADSAVAEFANMTALSLGELAKLPSGAAGVAKEINPAMLGTLVSLSGSLNAESKEAVLGFVQGLQGVDEETRKKFEQAVQGAIEGSEFGGEVAAKADELGCSYLEALAEVLQVHSPSRAVRDIFAQVVPGAMEGVDEGKEGLVQKGISLVTDFLNGLSASGGKAQGIGATMMSLFGIGISSQTGNSQTAGKSNADAANTGAGSVNPAGAGGIFARLFGNGVLGGRGSSKSAGKSNADAAKSGAGAVNPSQAGTTFGSQYASGVGSKSGASYNSGNSLATNANTGAGSESGYTPGSNFGSGFVRGIGSWISSAAGKAAELAKSALDAAKSALGIASPSKKMKQVGRWFARGFETGIENEAKNVEESAGQISEAALNAVNPEDIADRLKDINIPETMMRIYTVVDDQNNLAAEKIVSAVEGKMKLDYEMKTQQTIAVPDAILRKMAATFAEATAPILAKEMDGMGIYFKEREMARVIREVRIL